MQLALYNHSAKKKKKHLLEIHINIKTSKRSSCQLNAYY